MTNAEWMPELLTKADKAFMVSFQETHNQYAVTDEQLLGYLCGHCAYFDGYTIVADAYNLWIDAVNFQAGQDDTYVS